MSSFDDFGWLRRMLDDVSGTLDTRMVALNREVEAAMKAVVIPLDVINATGAPLQDAISASASNLDGIIQRDFPTAAELARSLSSIPSTFGGLSSLISERQFTLENFRPIFDDIASRVPWPSLSDQFAAEARLLADTFAEFRHVNIEQLKLSEDQIIATLERAIASSFPTISMLARDLAESVAAGSLSPAIAGGFGGELLERLQEAATIESDEAAASFLSALLAWLLLQARRVGIANPNFALTILITIGTLLYSNMQNAAQEERLIKELRSSTAILLEEIGRMAPPDSKTQAAPVRGLGTARSDPDEDAEVLAVLSDGQWVDVVEVHGKWVRVRFFDYVKGGECDAWILADQLFLPEE